jgi:hypothetical protein
MGYCSWVSFVGIGNVHIVHSDSLLDGSMVSFKRALFAKGKYTAVEHTKCRVIFTAYGE